MNITLYLIVVSNLAVAAVGVALTRLRRPCNDLRQTILKFGKGPKP